MPKASQKKCKKGWANVIKFRGPGNGGGLNKRAVVCITEDGVFVGRFESGAEAGRLTGLQGRNIRACCECKPRRVKIRGKERYYIRKHAGKTVDGRRLRWFYEDNDRWLELINN
jgi:hypothetical protein